MISLYTFLSLISTFVCLHLAAYVYFKNKKSRQNKLFSSLCLSLAFLCFVEFMFRESETPQRALFWLRFESVWSFSLALLLHFVLVYTKSLSRNVRKILFLVYLPAFAFSILNLLYYQISLETKHWGWSYQVAQTIIRDVQTFYIAITGIICLILLTRYHLRCTDSRIRHQNLFILMALPLPIFLHIINGLLLPRFFIELPPITFTSFAVMAAVIGYAVRRHALFSVSTTMAADTIIETVSEGLMVYNCRLQLEIFNPALKRILKKSASELTGRHIGSVFREMKDLTDIEDFTRKGLPSGIFTLSRNRNTTFPANISSSLLRDRAGKIRGVVLVVRDVTDQETARAKLVKARQELETRVEERTAELNEANIRLQNEIEEKTRAENLMRYERERLHVTLRSIRDGVIATDQEGRIILINEAASHLLDAPLENNLGKNLKDVYNVYETIEGKETVHDPIHSDTEEKEPSPLRNFYMYREDGSQRIIAETSAPIIDSSRQKTGTVIVFRDITHYRKIEEEHFKARKMESVSIMASGIAEEFSGLLSSIVTSIFMARMGIKPDSESNRLLTTAESAAFRANNMIKQLLTFSKNSTQSIKERASIGELITNSVGFYMQGLKSNYELTIEENLQDVDIDRGKIDQALNNIIVNADQAMSNEGTVAIKAYNTERKNDSSLSLQNGQYVCISVTDTGEGIEEKNLHRIFDPYYTTREKKMGLGLTTAYAIITQHGGKIEVESQKNQGSTFFIYLPALPPEEKEPAEESANEDDLVTS
ncbi:MAG: ATP-binding protein [Chitinispirillaceae bacterium]